MSDKPETVDLAYIGRLVAAFEATTTSLSERAASAEKRADQAEIRAERAETRADRAEQALAGERSRADRAEAARDVERAGADALRDRLHGMQEQLADAHAALQAAATAEARTERAERDKEQVEQGRETAEARADELRTRLDDMQVQLTTHQEVVDAAEAVRQADDTGGRSAGGRGSGRRGGRVMLFLRDARGWYAAQPPVVQLGVAPEAHRTAKPHPDASRSVVRRGAGSVEQASAGMSADRALHDTALGSRPRTYPRTIARVKNGRRRRRRSVDDI